MIVLTGAVFLVLLVLAVPVAFTMGVTAFTGLWWSGAYPLTIILQQVFLSVDSFVLCIGLLLVILFPWLTLVLPRLFGL